MLLGGILGLVSIFLFFIYGICFFSVNISIVMVRRLSVVVTLFFAMLVFVWAVCRLIVVRFIVPISTICVMGVLTTIGFARSWVIMVHGFY